MPLLWYVKDCEKIACFSDPEPLIMIFLDISSNFLKVKTIPSKQSFSSTQKAARNQNSLRNPNSDHVFRSIKMPLF